MYNVDDLGPTALRLSNAKIQIIALTAKSAHNNLTVNTL